MKIRKVNSGGGGFRLEDRVGRGQSVYLLPEEVQQLREHFAAEADRPVIPDTRDCVEAWGARLDTGELLPHAFPNGDVFANPVRVIITAGDVDLEPEAAQGEFAATEVERPTEDLRPASAPNRPTPRERAAAAVADRITAMTGVARFGITDLIPLLELIFGLCREGRNPGVPPRPDEVNELVLSMKQPSIEQEEHFRSSIWRQVVKDIQPERGRRGRRLREAREYEYAVQYWAFKDTVRDSSDEQLRELAEDFLTN